MSYDYLQVDSYEIKVLKAVRGRELQVHSQLLVSSCTILGWVGIKMKLQASPLFWFQPIWLRLQSAVFWWGSVSCKNNLGMCVRLLSGFSQGIESVVTLLRGGFIV